MIAMMKKVMETHPGAKPERTITAVKEIGDQVVVTGTVKLGTIVDGKWVKLKRCIENSRDVMKRAMMTTVVVTGGDDVDADC